MAQPLWGAGPWEWSHHVTWAVSVVLTRWGAEPSASGFFTVTASGFGAEGCRRNSRESAEPGPGHNANSPECSIHGRTLDRGDLQGPFQPNHSDSVLLVHQALAEHPCSAPPQVLHRRCPVSVIPSPPGQTAVLCDSHTPNHACCSVPGIFWIDLRAPWITTNCSLKEK